MGDSILFLGTITQIPEVSTLILLGAALVALALLGRWKLKNKK